MQFIYFNLIVFSSYNKLWCWEVWEKFNIAPKTVHIQILIIYNDLKLFSISYELISF